MDNLTHAIYSAASLTLITLTGEIMTKQPRNLKKHAFIFLAAFAFTLSLNAYSVEVRDEAGIFKTEPKVDYITKVQRDSQGNRVDYSC